MCEYGHVILSYADGVHPRDDIVQEFAMKLQKEKKNV
jgi:hypothetical protein